MQVNILEFLPWHLSHLHLKETDWLDFLNIDLILFWTLPQFTHGMFLALYWHFLQNKTQFMTNGISAKWWLRSKKN